MKRQTHSLSFKNDPLKLQYVRIAVTGTSIRQEFQISRSSLQRILTRHIVSQCLQNPINTTTEAKSRVI